MQFNSFINTIINTFLMRNKCKLAIKDGALIISSNVAEIDSKNVGDEGIS